MRRNPIFISATLTRRKLLLKAATLCSTAAAAPVLCILKPAFAAHVSEPGADEATLPLRDYPKLFNSREKVMGSAHLLGPKVRVLDLLAMNGATRASFSSRDREALECWLEALESVRSLDRQAQIRAVNNYVNKAPFRPDPSKNGISGTWITPPELFRRGGDCEDYVVAKYLSLSYLGFHDDRLRLVALRLPRTRRARPQRRMHVVLAVYLNGTASILDNLYNYVYAHNEAISYRPIFSLNRSTLWRHEV